MFNFFKLYKEEKILSILTLIYHYNASEFVLVVISVSSRPYVANRNSELYNIKKCVYSFKRTPRNTFVEGPLFIDEKEPYTSA